MLGTPLQVLVCAHPSDRTSAVISETIENCFVGGGDGYLSGGDDLDVPVDVLDDISHLDVETHLDSALHTLLVVLVNRDLLDPVANQELHLWLDSCGRHIGESSSRHGLLLVDLDNSIEEFRSLVPNVGWSQPLIAATLGERAVQATVVGLVTLHNALKSVSSGSGRLADKMQFFVSHAKIDGQALARTINSTIEQIPGLEGFYDANDLPPGANWRDELRRAAQNSIMLILRSDVYESRSWCVQEATWAEEFASPIAVVDLRHRLLEPPSTLALDRGTSVRVTDGNYYRVIFVGIREGLRSALHVRRVQDLIDRGRIADAGTAILVRRPTMLGLHRACLDLIGEVGKEGVLAEEHLCHVVYPDPPLRQGELEAAAALAASVSPSIRLTTVSTLVATPVGVAS